MWYWGLNEGEPHTRHMPYSLYHATGSGMKTFAATSQRLSGIYNQQGDGNIGSNGTLEEEGVTCSTKGFGLELSYLGGKNGISFVLSDQQKLHNK